MKTQSLRFNRHFLSTLVLAVTFAQGTFPASRPEKLDNALQVILVENHSSPMIASVIFVRSGSKYESEYENGITHFLEHLLFDGTTHLTRQELGNSIRDLGGYINAFTREDLTAYMVLMPKQYIEYGLTVQADMLFNSTFPEEELAKERQVVIEEIKRDTDSPGASAEAFFREKAYGETDYGRPVLGYEPFIANIKREAIIAYWKNHYTPDKMTALVIGDFESKSMKKTLARVFERIPGGKPQNGASPGDLHRKLAEGKQRVGGIIGQHRYDTIAAVASAHLNFSIEAPSFGSGDYLPFDLLVQYLALDEISPLKVALQSGDDPLATEVTVSLNTCAEFARMDISIISEKPQFCDSIVSVTLAALSQMSSHIADTDDLRGITTSVRCQSIYNAEKLHYYAFIVAPLMMVADWDWIQSYPDRLDSVTWNQCQEAARRWLDQSNYILTVVRPADSQQAIFTPEVTTSEDVNAYFDSASFPLYDLTRGIALDYPKTDSVTFELVDKAVYRREVLDNGLTVLVKSGKGSRVFAVNLLGKDRTLWEAEDKAGITDFVNRCLAKGTTNRTGEQLNRELGAIGANLTLTDNPWIPYDDRYTTRSFSFIKFETIEPYAKGGFELLADMVLHPAFDSLEIENVRKEMLGVISRGAGSPSQAARDLYFAALFDQHPFAKPIMGSAATIAAISPQALRDFHRDYYAPGNMILSIVTSRDTSEVMAWVRESFGSVSPPDNWSPTPSLPLPTAEPGEFHHELQKEQIAICAGGRVPGISSSDAIDLQVAASILSSRLNEVLRERQGLAYTTGAGVDFTREFGWYLVSIATGYQNYQSALDGLALQTEKLALDGPRESEIRSACNQLWGQLMSAKLSRINQAYYLGLDEYWGREIGYDRQLLKALARVNVHSVGAAAAKYFRPNLWITATAGKKP
ncbi:MAG: pitrilysin family protein [Candidatus Zixiibacteriota bacterium]